MNFCENCRTVSDNVRCPLCGGKKLRQVHSYDFCLLTEADTAYCGGLIEAFKANDIKFSALPYGRGVESKFGLPLENYRLYVPFNSLEKAKAIISKTETSETDELRKYLLDNAHMLNISDKKAKRISKKANLAEDIFEYCIGVVKSADKITDGGAVSGFTGGHYLFCY